MGIKDIWPRRQIQEEKESNIKCNCWKPKMPEAESPARGLCNQYKYSHNYGEFLVCAKNNAKSFINII